MLIELTQKELACILLWNNAYSWEEHPTDLDDELYKKLYNLFNSSIELPKPIRRINVNRPDR